MTASRVAQAVDGAFVSMMFSWNLECVGCITFPGA